MAAVSSIAEEEGVVEGLYAVGLFQYRTNGQDRFVRVRFPLALPWFNATGAQGSWC